MRLATGVTRLDELLKGGIPEGDFSLVYGPPFIGKETLARLFFLTGYRQDTPSVYIVTGRTSEELRTDLTRIDPDYPRFERSGQAWFIDTYSRSVGADEDHPYTEYVDGPMNLNGISLALNNVQRRLVQEHRTHRLVLDSVSTLIAYINAQTAFRFMQVLIGKARRAGATGMFLLDEGMHTEAEVQTFKHLADGEVAFRNHNGKNQLQVQGLGIQEVPGWVDYRADERSLEITGSFAAGRIR